jgi:hypothetical protein
VPLRHCPTEDPPLPPHRIGISCNDGGASYKLVKELIAFQFLLSTPLESSGGLSL